MFNGFSSLRALVYLRRIARELHRANDLAEARLAIEHPAHYKSRVKLRQKGPAKLGEISTAKIEEWNKNYSRLHPEANAQDPDYIP